MKKTGRIILIVLFLSVIICSFALSLEYKSLDAINSYNWASFVNAASFYPGVFDEGINFFPSDIYLLSKTVPLGSQISIKTYSDDKSKNIISKDSPFFSSLFNSQSDIEKTKNIFKDKGVELVVYPLAEKVFLVVSGEPYAQIDVGINPNYKFFPVKNVDDKGKARFVGNVSNPISTGNYAILSFTAHYVSDLYYKETYLPFGAWIIKKIGTYFFYKDGAWYRVPKFIEDDLLKNEMKYDYYDVTFNGGIVESARWGSNVFGKDVMVWTKDGSAPYYQFGFSPKDILLEQAMIIKNLVYLLSSAKDKDFDSLIGENAELSLCRSIYEFVESNGKKHSNTLPKKQISFYKLFYGFEMSKSEKGLIGEEFFKAFYEYKNNILPRNKIKRQKALGLYKYIEKNVLAFDKKSQFYRQLVENRVFIDSLRGQIAEDLDSMGIFSLANRQNVIETWILNRMEFKPATIPSKGKNIGELNFSSFFDISGERDAFYEREQKAMSEELKKAVSDESYVLNLKSVQELNDYNFGVLVNDILGDLYKSHGCLHVSPRNSYFLFELLPVNTPVFVYDYSKKIDHDKFKDIPYLTDLISFEEDMPALAEKFKNYKDVKAVIYPSSGFWLIYIKDKPFAKVLVKGGAKEKFYNVVGRDKNGHPIFEPNLAYPTTPGNYYIFKKVKNYISNLYYDTTVVPMGGLILKEKGKWFFIDESGKKKPLPDSIARDLSSKDKDYAYKYYDVVENLSKEVERARWGDHPFGKYAIQTTSNKKTPSPELIHSSGTLIMEERQIISDIIKVLSAPFDDIEDCVSFSENFDLYKTCYDFIKDPNNRSDLLSQFDSASYKLYYSMSLTSIEASLLKEDSLIAEKVLRGDALSLEDKKILLKENIASSKNGKFSVNRQKILGIHYDTYRYVVAIEKNAHHYEVLKNNWESLSKLRRAMLEDFNNFAIKDPEVFYSFVKELMLMRDDLKRISRKEVLEILEKKIN